MRARAIFAVGMLLGACRGPSAPSSAGASSAVVATDDAAVDDSMAPPEEHPSGDPACTAVATRADIGAETCTAIFDAIGYEIAGRAHAAGLRINGVGIMQCAAGAGYYVTTDDPQMGIALQKITRDVMKDWNIRGTIYVRVAPIPKVIPL